MSFFNGDGRVLESRDVLHPWFSRFSLLSFPASLPAALSILVDQSPVLVWHEVSHEDEQHELVRGLLKLAILSRLSDLVRVVWVFHVTRPEPR